MPLYNIPALAKAYKVTRARVQVWFSENRLPEPDDYVGRSPVWYSIPPRPEDNRKIRSRTHKE